MSNKGLLEKTPQPTLDDIIQDPATGTGGFLIAANRYIRNRRTPGNFGRIGRSGDGIVGKGRNNGTAQGWLTGW